MTPSAPTSDRKSTFLHVQAWAEAYVASTSLETKVAPPAPPSQFERNPPVRDVRPGRPPELEVTLHKPKSVKLGALARPEVRAALHHKFWHHELQAAELACWAILKFPDAPSKFHQGLLRIFRDEVRHMGMYQKHIEALGFGLSSFPVRDWFWDRVPTCETPVQFVALLGMGLEGANLDHTARFSHWLRSVGDEAGAKIQEQVGREEVAHVRFANRWFRKWTGDVCFETWRRSLPPPLSPLLMRGKTVNIGPRVRAEFPREFLTDLASWQPDGKP
jgi:uncharacterized ferritin-like protein (DUF455 family)